MELRKFADAIDKELDRINQERQHWLNMKASVENVMRIRAEPMSELITPAQTAPIAQESQLPVRRRARGTPGGEISMRRAVIRVLQAAAGKPMRVEDVLTEALKLGAITNSSNPANVLDRQLYGLRDRDHEPIEKSGKRLWRWAGAANSELRDGDASRQEELIQQEARP